jgi:hypothetical protein
LQSPSLSRLAQILPPRPSPRSSSPTHRLREPSFCRMVGEYGQEEKGRSVNLGPRRARLEGLYVLQRDIASSARCFAQRAGRRGSGLEFLLDAQGARARVRREVECPTPAYVRSSHGGAAHSRLPPAISGREDARPRSPDVHALAVVAPGGLDVTLVGRSGGDYTVANFVVDLIVIVGVASGKTSAGWRVVAGRLSIVSCGYRVEDYAKHRSPCRLCRR